MNNLINHKDNSPDSQQDCTAIAAGADPVLAPKIVGHELGHLKGQGRPALREAVDGYGGLLMLIGCHKQLVITLPRFRQFVVVGVARMGGLNSCHLKFLAGRPYFREPFVSLLKSGELIGHTTLQRRKAPAFARRTNTRSDYRSETH